MEHAGTSGMEICWILTPTAMPWNMMPLDWTTCCSGTFWNDEALNRSGPSGCLYWNSLWRSRYHLLILFGHVDLKVFNWQIELSTELSLEAFPRWWWGVNAGGNQPKSVRCPTYQSARCSLLCSLSAMGRYLWVGCTKSLGLLQCEPPNGDVPEAMFASVVRIWDGTSRECLIDFLICLGAFQRAQGRVSWRFWFTRAKCNHVA